MSCIFGLPIKQVDRVMRRHNAETYSSSPISWSLSPRVKEWESGEEAGRRGLLTGGGAARFVLANVPTLLSTPFSLVHIISLLRSPVLDHPQSAA
jgi:hypothetical protein